MYEAVLLELELLFNNTLQNHVLSSEIQKQAAGSKQTSVDIFLNSKLVHMHREWWCICTSTIFLYHYTNDIS